MGVGQNNQIQEDENDKNFFKNAAKMSLQQVKGIMKTEDPNFKKLERISQKKREEELQEQIEKLK